MGRRHVRSKQNNCILSLCCGHVPTTGGLLFTGTSLCLLSALGLCTTGAHVPQKSDSHSMQYVSARLGHSTHDMVPTATADVVSTSADPSPGGPERVFVSRPHRCSVFLSNAQKMSFKCTQNVNQMYAHLASISHAIGRSDTIVMHLVRISLQNIKCMKNVATQVNGVRNVCRHGVPA
jgi:hypothetical protein